MNGVEVCGVFVGRFSGRPWCPLLLSVLVLSGFSCHEAPPKRTIDFRLEIAQLPQLYLSSSGKRLEAPPPPLDQRYHILDGEIYWPTMMCQNEDCPRAGETPTFVFPVADPFVMLEDGELVDRPPEDLRNLSPAEADAYLAKQQRELLLVCPACSEKFGLNSADDETLMRYQMQVVSYELPETQARREELQQEVDALRDGYRRRVGKETAGE